MRLSALIKELQDMEKTVGDQDVYLRVEPITEPLHSVYQQGFAQGSLPKNVIVLSD